MTPPEFPDIKRAVLRVPLHFLASIPVAAATVVVPPIGSKYVAWRADAEKDDVDSKRDSPLKAAVDYQSQIILVRGILGLWHKLT